MRVTHSLDVPTLIHGVEVADSAPALIAAVRALAAAKSPAAIETLITVLGFNNPGAAVAAVEGLVNLGEAAVPALLEQLDGYNYGARAWAIRSLAMIGDPRALAVLAETAKGDFALSVRRAAAKGLGFIAWHKLSDEDRSRARALALEALTIALADSEWVVRYAAVVGLSGLSESCGQGSSEWVTIKHQLENCVKSDEEAVVRARAQWALT